MKRFMFFIVIAVTIAGSLRAAPVGEAEARQVADKFFVARAARFSTSPGQTAIQLAYTAEQGRFYVFERGTHSGFVVVAGDDRLPQVLGYGDKGDFSAGALPPAVQYWMDEMDRQIAFLQTHSEVQAHQPAKRQTAVGPLMTTRWDQTTPYNDYCPTYTDSHGNTLRAVTGCVATATAQVMNYWQWPPVGRGSHSYHCIVAGMTPTDLSADFSQSHYRWDLMLDDYDESSSPEACDAVARLMSDIGIASEMGYGSGSGTWEFNASDAMQHYFGYCNKCYWCYRDAYDAAEWDQLLVDEISLRRPVMYCGDTNNSGHAFVLDGFDCNGYFHVNWGWGGYYDGYFLVSVLAPASRYYFNNRQRGLFGLVPETQADEVEDVLLIHGFTIPYPSSVPLGSSIGMEIYFSAEGNALDTAGYELWDGDKYYYSHIPVKLGLYDSNGVECKSETTFIEAYLDYFYLYSLDVKEFELPQSLPEGEYHFKVYYSKDKGATYEHPLLEYCGKEMYFKVIVEGDTAYIKDRFLYNSYGVESFTVPAGVRVNDTFDVDLKVSYKVDWLYEDEELDGPVGNVYLSLLKDGTEVAKSPMCEVSMASNEAKTYRMPLTAPSQWGLYELVLNDETGNQLMEMDGYLNRVREVTAPFYILPECQDLVEDFETMTPNNSIGEKNVQGQFASWNFIKSGVCTPGDGKCNGSNAVMLKKPSALYTTQELRHNFFLAQATFFNPAAAAAKYTLEYSLDGGASWEKAPTIDSLYAAEVQARSQLCATWMLHLTAAQPALFRIAMTGGGTAATYVDDIILYYIDLAGDINGDAAVNIADVNAVINLILNDKQDKIGDVNGDGTVNIADINAVINLILK